VNTKTDKTLLILTALFVGGLAFVAGAISFAYMRELATHHDQLGWKSYAFPISVDGLEIVANSASSSTAMRPQSATHWSSGASRWYAVCLSWKATALRTWARAHGEGVMHREVGLGLDQSSETAAAGAMQHPHGDHVGAYPLVEAARGESAKPRPGLIRAQSRTSGLLDGGEGRVGERITHLPSFEPRQPALLGCPFLRPSNDSYS
jgi:hypothetical protein